jgi:hypothetical protein
MLLPPLALPRIVVFASVSGFLPFAISFWRHQKEAQSPFWNCHCDHHMPMLDTQSESQTCATLFENGDIS